MAQKGTTGASMVTFRLKRQPKTKAEIEQKKAKPSVLIDPRV